jgi:acetyl-CoA carboxylase biotin carboxylase subunit
VCIGPARADRSYLDADAVLQAAEQTECQAVHPGYGFLAENARFAARCEQQGITFIGPGPGAIRRMGDKMQAKRTMAEAGLPVIPGSLDTLGSAADAAGLAGEIGYPVLLKATAGGGGKGMRRCDDPTQLRRAFEEASREAEKAFGDPSLYLEKYLEGGRHVEFQVLADAFGSAVHLGERDCSVQRHHQKLLEESPSPALGAEEREELGGAIARAVAAIGYRNAGTVELLRESGGRLYFMEMNTRLQVEHPVTEAVTGVDLVVQQFRVAALHPLGMSQADVRMEGHAVEFRINAEDPDAGFRPDPGTIRSFEAPPSTCGPCTVRWDAAVEEGWRIPPHYDSMIGKLIVHGPDRAAALDGAVEALGALRIEGVKTTVPLHLRILADPEFRAGRYDVGFLAGRFGARAGR